MAGRVQRIPRWGCLNRKQAYQKKFSGLYSPIFVDLLKVVANSSPYIFKYMENFCMKILASSAIFLLLCSTNAALAEYSCTESARGPSSIRSTLANNAKASADACVWNNCSRDGHRPDSSSRYSTPAQCYSVGGNTEVCEVTSYMVCYSKN
ncbi:hypothetical protein LCGC14_0228100 [marine sediment metagenome]|uniref:Uncharacterized protein n=1 Tax=marine sediment metagenome TaxID=412755 RepID=A0A0F9WVM6_9ZZZZ